MIVAHQIRIPTSTEAVATNRLGSLRKRHKGFGECECRKGRSRRGSDQQRWTERTASSCNIILLSNITLTFTGPQ